MEDPQSSTNDFDLLRDMDEQDGVSQESVNADEEESPSSNEQLVGFGKYEKIIMIDLHYSIIFNDRNVISN